MRIAFAGAIIAALTMDKVDANMGRQHVYRAINSGDLSNYDSDK